MQGTVVRERSLPLSFHDSIPLQPLPSQNADLPLFPPTPKGATEVPCFCASQAAACGGVCERGIRAFGRQNEEFGLGGGFERKV